MTTKKLSKFKRNMLIIIASLTAVFVLLAIISFPLKTVYYNVMTDKITKPVRIAQISDLHSCKYGENMKNLINALDKTSPDAVVLTGDFYDETLDNENTRIFLKAVGRKYPCYYITGNHESRTGDIGKIMLEVDSYGIKVLAGDNAAFGEITICGAAPKADEKQSFVDSVSECAKNADEENFNILLAHYPEQIDYYRGFEKFDLILSGHTHGGQWRIPVLVNGLYAPGQGLFPKYAGGRYDFDNTAMIVSRGLSRTKNIVPRIFNNPELVIIDITPENQ